MITREDVKKLRMFINTTKRMEQGLKMPKNIESIVDGICKEYEKKYETQ